MTISTFRFRHPSAPCCEAAQEIIATTASELDHALDESRPTVQAVQAERIPHLVCETVVALNALAHAHPLPCTAAAETVTQARPIHQAPQAASSVTTTRMPCPTLRWKSRKTEKKTSLM